MVREQLSQSLQLLLVVVLAIFVAVPSTASEIPDDKLNYASYDEADEKASELLKRVLIGMGGEQNLRNTASVRKAAKVIRRTSKGEMETDFVGIAVFPDTFHVRFSTPQREISGVLLENTGWIFKSDSVVRGGALRLNDDERKSFLQYFYEHPFLVVKNRFNPSYYIASGGTTRIGSSDVDVLCVLIAGIPSRWYVDKKTSRVLRTRFIGVETDFDDWKKVGEIVIPFKETVRRNGRVVGRMVTTRVDLNLQFDEALFRQPTLWISREALPGKTFGESGNVDLYDYYQNDLRW